MQRIYAMGDAYPKFKKLPKGEYNLQLHIRYEFVFMALLYCTIELCTQLFACDKVLQIPRHCFALNCGFVNIWLISPWTILAFAFLTFLVFE